MKIVAMIPARCGSKGLPDKNIKNLCGRPLLSYPIEAALGCDLISEVYLNSDSPLYLDIGKKFGAQPFLRAGHLATDEASMKSVVVNFIDVLQKQGKHFEAVIVLYPVYPLRTSADLRKIITAFQEAGGDRSLIGLKKPDTHPYLCYRLDPDHVPHTVMDFDVNVFFRRQLYPEYFEFTAWAMMLPTDSLPTLNAQLMNENSYGYVIPDNISIVDIDTPLDFKFAEFLLQSGEYYKNE